MIDAVNVFHVSEQLYKVVFRIFTPPRTVHFSNKLLRLKAANLIRFEKCCEGLICIGYNGFEPKVFAICMIKFNPVVQLYELILVFYFLGIQFFINRLCY